MCRRGDCARKYSESRVLGQTNGSSQNSPRRGQLRRSSGGGFVQLVLVGGSLEPRDGGQHGNHDQGTDEDCSRRRQVSYQYGCAATHGTSQVHGENGAALPQAKVSQAVGGVVFARRGKRKQAATRAGDGDERGVKNRGAEDKDGGQPTGGRGGMFEPEFQRECGHQKSQEHRAAIAHENLGRLEIPAQETSRRTQDRRCKRGDKCLAVQVSDEGEENGGHGGDAGAQAIHVIQNAEGGGDADDPKNSKRRVEPLACMATEQHAEDLSVDAAGQKNHSGQRHAYKEFDLVMQPTTVIQKTNDGDQSGAGDDAETLRPRGAVESDE